MIPVYALELRFEVLNGKESAFMAIKSHYPIPFTKTVSITIFAV